jgi:hypothetical protein
MFPAHVSSPLSNEMMPSLAMACVAPAYTPKAGPEQGSFSSLFSWRERNVTSEAEKLSIGRFCFPDEVGGELASELTLLSRCTKA